MKKPKVYNAITHYSPQHNMDADAIIYTFWMSIPRVWFNLNTILEKHICELARNNKVTDQMKSDMFDIFLTLLINPKVPADAKNSLCHIMEQM